MHTLADKAEIALTRPEQVFEALRRLGQNRLSFRSLVQALYVCMFSPTGGFGSLANTCRDDSTHKKTWGAHRLKDGKQQFSIKRGQETPRIGRRIDTFETRLGDQASAHADAVQSGATVSRNPQHAALHMLSLSRSTTELVRRL